MPSEDGSIVQQICCILRSNEPAITINVINVGIQAGSNDCGLFAIAMAYDLCAGIDPVTKAYTQGEMRSPPLMFQQQTLFQALINTSLEIYCVCRMPELAKRMVCCDCCGITKAVYQFQQQCSMIKIMKFLGNARKVQIHFVTLFYVHSHAQVLSVTLLLPVDLQSLCTPRERGKST